MDSLFVAGLNNAHRRGRMKMEAKAISGYEVTRDGKVFSVDSNWRGLGRRELRQSLNKDGYPTVRLTIGKRRVRYTVHRLVALHHLPPPPTNSHEVRHLDGNKLNPKLENLAWGTQKENAADRERHGRTSRGAQHGSFIKRSDHAEKVRAFHIARKEKLHEE